MSLTGGLRTKATLSRYPVTSGTTAETTKTEGRQINLVPVEESHVSKKDKKGLMD